jgi:U3 small nucleolar RNA-associated protein 25
LTVKADPFSELVLQKVLPVHKTTFHKRLSTACPSSFSTLLGNYPDVLCNELQPSENLITKVLLSHVLNHIYKSKSLISENNSSPSPIKDQAFTPAIVLLLVPDLEKAKNVIDFFLDSHCKGQSKRMTKFSRKKYSEVFHEDFDPKADAVKFGITFGERDLNLFSSFKRSDLILATPLSLRQGIEKKGSPDTGILCSVEICVVLECAELLMQNWEHVETVFENMNCLPDRDSVSNDLNRIRDSYLDGNSRKYRQLIISSPFFTPVIMNLFNSNLNFRGKVRTVLHFSPSSLKTIQKFKKFNPGTSSEISMKRFEFFVGIWGRLKEEMREKSVLFISDYFEFVRVKAWLEENDPGVLCLSEYTCKPERQRCLALWKNRSNQVLCITERLVFFRPFSFDDVGNVVFYEIPVFAKRYFEIVEKAQESLALYSRFDAFALQRVVGDAQAQKMV